VSRFDWSRDNVKFWESEWNWRDHFIIVDERCGLAGWVLGVWCAWPCDGRCIRSLHLENRQWVSPTGHLLTRVWFLQDYIREKMILENQDE
jgi:hypothetical protein